MSWEGEELLVEGEWDGRDGVGQKLVIIKFVYFQRSNKLDRALPPVILDRSALL